jgi:hypothetical protein
MSNAPISPLTNRTDSNRLWLPKASDPGNLVRFRHLPHTHLTYHRTWETGLETEIRVADFSPAFFCLPRGSSIPFNEIVILSAEILTPPC